MTRSLFWQRLGVLAGFATLASLASCSSAGGGDDGGGNSSQGATGSNVQPPTGSGGSATSTAGASPGAGSGNVMLDPMIDPDCPTPLSCMPPGGQYCGVIGDGCQGAQDCGAGCARRACASADPIVSQWRARRQAAPNIAV